MFPIETTILRQRPWPAFLIMAIAIGILFIPQKSNDPVPMYVAAGVFAFSILLYFLIKKTQIIVDDSGITYRTAFRTRVIPWDSVSKTYLRSEHHGKSRSLYWYFENPEGKKSKFSLDLFSRKSIRIIAEAVTMKCKTAEIEPRIYDMAEGQFPWYIR